MNICRPDGVTGYIRVVVFSQNAAADVQNAIQELTSHVCELHSMTDVPQMLSLHDSLAHLGIEHQPNLGWLPFVFGAHFA